MNEKRFDMGQLLRQAFEAKLSDICVSLPAKVLSYDAAKQTVKLQLLIKRVRKDATGEVTANEIQPLQQVPVAFPRCAGGWITFPLAADDVGMVVFAHRSLKEWTGKSAGEVVEPTDDEVLSLNGGWFYPGGYPEKSPLDGGADEENVVIHTETMLDLGEKGLTDDDMVAIGKLVDDRIDDLRQKHNNHTHPSGMGPTGTPTTPIASQYASVKCTKVRAK